MGASRVPKNVAAALRKCCPDGVVEAFLTDESYFHEIRDALAGLVGEYPRLHIGHRDAAVFVS